MTLFKWPSINLWTAKNHCKHKNWMYEYSLKRKTCYDCGCERTITNDMPVHTR